MWIRLVSGFPSVHSYHRDDAVPPALGSPIDFQTEFLRKLTGAEPRVVRRGEKRDPATWESWGRVGTAGSWVTWRAWGIVDDSSAYTESYVAELPTIRFQWDVEYLKSGYRHIPRHLGLRVEFKDRDTERTFRRTWEEVFGQPARFARPDHREPATGEHPGP